MSPTRRIGYARVSTASGEQLAALENQRSRLETAGVDEIIQDVQSGRDTDRAGYLQLLDLIDRRQLREIVITRVDRLGRDAADTDAAIAFAAKRGVTLTALDGGQIESETPQGFLMSRILTSMAEMESRMLSMRIHSGLRSARAKQRPLRGRAPWGYRITDDKTAFMPDPVEFERASQFLKVLFRCGWRMTTALDVWAAEGRGDIPLHSCRAVRAWLLNPILRGGIGYRQQKNHTYAEIAWNCHKPLVDSDEYEVITAMLDLNRRMWGHNVTIRPRLLTSLCRCFHCRNAMPYAGGRTYPSVLCKTRGCPQCYHSTRETVIAQAINVELSRRAKDLITVIAEEPPDAAKLLAEITELEARNDTDLEDAIARKQQRYHALCNKPKTDSTLVAALGAPNFWTHYSYEEMRELYHELVATVSIRAQHVEHVQLKF